MTMNTPLYAKAAAVAGRPIVLIASLIMAAPAEVSLARTAGFHGGYELLAPFLLSLYAICASAIATARQKGDRGRLSAILGAVAATGFVLSAQVVAHLLAGGYMVSGPWLVAAVSSAPAICAAHLLHLGAMPRPKHLSENPTVGVTNQDSGHDTTDSSENEDDKGVDTAHPPTHETGTSESEVSLESQENPAKTIGRPKPSLQKIREVADTLDKTGQKVTAATLAASFGVSDRTGARYKGMLVA
ncbi:hypothetical protein ACIRD8_15075 [Streptomyces sp. NPDC102451]|uniref:hypothetical protein n=1 Tax=Streptomyces sp. NPDC102451 TaxID=3366177 RepID=UPI0038138867